jgi:hypothetical protein
LYRSFVSIADVKRLIYLDVQAKHEVDSIASLRAVREWSASVGRLERTGAGIQGMLQHTFNLVAKRYYLQSNSQILLRSRSI